MAGHSVWYIPKIQGKSHVMLIRHDNNFFQTQIQKDGYKAVLLISKFLNMWMSGLVGGSKRADKVTE